MLMEILQLATSSFGAFLGCMFVLCVPVMCVGWALNAVLLGFKGISVENPWN